MSPAPVAGGRVALVVNPTAGRGRARDVGRQVAQRLQAAGLTVDDHTSGTADAAATRTAGAVAAGVDALVVVGGDGAAHLGLNVVAGSATPLGVVAAGAGNDLARALGLPVHDAAASADVLVASLRSGRSRRIDAVRWSGAGGTGWFGAVLAAGFDALVNERANGWSWLPGTLRYNLAIARELPVLRPRRYRITVDGDTADVEAVLVAVANSPSYGGGMRVAPDARLDDALLDLVVLGPVGRAGLLRLYPRVFSGSHVSDPRVLVRRGRVIEVDAAGIVGYADGERLGTLPVRCEAVAGAVQVLAPPP